MARRNAHNAQSDSESDEPLEVSQLDTPFVAQSGDEEVMWEVEEITAEKGQQYKVKWAGVDPDTKKPWPQSWVSKEDCTDELVMEWKVKQAEQRKAKEKAKRRKCE